MTKSDKLPAIQFYPGDWRKDVGIQALDYESRGVWLELLMLMHESERRGYLILNGAPMTDEMVGKILGIHGNKWKKIKRKLEVTGVASIEEKTGILFNRRMVRDQDIREKRSEAGKLGGNPAFEQGKPNPYYTDKQIDKQNDNQKITPSSSSSSSSSISLKRDSKKISHKIKLKEGREVILKSVSDGALNKALRGWCDWRENEHPKKKPVTPQALKQLLKRYENKAAQLITDIRWSVSQDWDGVYAQRKQTQPEQNFNHSRAPQNAIARNLVQSAMPKVNR